jgi:hypothetical protein
MRRWLTRLYPRAWRQRYEAEFVALLEQQPLTLGIILDVVRGALDAHGRGPQGATGADHRRGQMARRTQVTHCSFCGKSQAQDRRLIGGPGGISICQECVALCHSILAEQGPPTPAGQPRSAMGSRWRHLVGGAFRLLRGQRHAWQRPPVV